jgi:hypothetical protein
MKEVLKMINYYLNGEISLDDNDQSRMNYLIEDLSTKEKTSITDILDGIYNGNNTIKKLVRVSGRLYNSHALPFNGFESLHISKDKYGTYSYHVGNFPIENQLYEMIGKCCELVIEDYTDVSGITEDIQYGTTKTM